MKRSFSDRTPADFEWNEFSRRIEAVKASGKKILDLTCSNPTRAGLAVSSDELREALARPGMNAYDPDPRGMRVARERVAQWMGVSDVDRLWLTSGTSEAYGHILKLLCDVGDDVLIPSPSYPLLAHLCELEGVVPRPVPLQFDGKWRLDMKAIDEATGERTRAIMVVHPNNPTGSFLENAEIEALLAWSRKKGIAIISDEVFLPFPLDGKTRPSLATRSGEARIFCLNGLSKMFGLPQMKLSWIYAGVPLEEWKETAQRLDFISDHYLSVSTPIQLALSELEVFGQANAKRISGRIQASHAVLKEVSRQGMTYLAPEGGWAAILRLDDSIDEEVWAISLMETKGVLVQPGYFFDLPFPASCVVSLLTAPGDLRRGLSF